MSTLLRCYNKGCQKDFDPQNNTDESCLFHPGDPVFHDAKKKWSCCNKYSTDFSEFLSLKGCTKGRHTNVKPVAPPKPEKDEVCSPEIVESSPAPVAPTPIYERPLEPSQLVDLKVDIKPSLVEALKGLEIAVEKKSSENNNKIEIAKGTKCFNSGCKALYEGPASESQLCTYHSGMAIFHEGAKYWTCCQRKTSDFEAFLEQEGCTTGQHNWTKESALSCNLALSAVNGDTSCRFDWFQLPNTITVNIYAKEVIPETVSIKANEINLVVSFQYGSNKTPYSKSFILKGVIDPNSSNVNLLAKKVEINLKKANAMSWPKLELEPPV